MSLINSLESVPVFGQGVKWFETEMHDTLFQHSVFGAIVFLIVSNTGVYAFVREIIFDITGMKLDGNTLQLFHAIVFAVIMYFGSMYLFSPLLGEGYKDVEGRGDVEHNGGADEDDERDYTTKMIEEGYKNVEGMCGGKHDEGHDEGYKNVEGMCGGKHNEGYRGTEGLSMLGDGNYNAPSAFAFWE